MTAFFASIPTRQRFNPAYHRCSHRAAVIICCPFPAGITPAQPLIRNGTVAGEMGALIFLRRSLS